MNQKDAVQAVNPSDDRQVRTKSGKVKTVKANKSCPAFVAHEHTAASCGIFKKLSIDGRWNFFKENKLCHRCFVSHTRWPCEGEVCGINNCDKRHHSEPTKKQTVTDATVTIHRQPISSTLFKILPVTLYGKNGSVNTYAFLDDGSSVTIVEKSYCRRTGSKQASAFLVHPLE